MHGAMVRNWFKLALELTVGLVGILHSPPKNCKQVQTVCSTSGFAIFLGKRKHTAGKEGIGGRAQLHHKSGKAETWRNKKANKEETTEKQKAKNTMTETKKTKRNFNK